MAVLDVHLVAPDRKVWSGEATFVVARSANGDMGVLPGHEPVLAILGIGPVKIEQADGQTVIAAVDGGFLSVSNVDGRTSVNVLAEHVTLQDEIDNSEVQSIETRAEELRESGDTDAARAEEAKAAVRRRLSN